MRQVLVSSVTGSAPVTVGELKDWLKLPTGQVDSSLQLIVDAATAAVADKIGQTIRASALAISYDLQDIPPGFNPWWDGVREGPITMFSPPALELRDGPTNTIESVLYYDVGDNQYTYASSNYRLSKPDPKQEAKLVLTIGAVWPTNMRTVGAFVVNVTAGYADGAVPPEIRLAILMTAAWSYTNRAPCSGACCDACGATKVLGDLVRVRPAMGRPKRSIPYSGAWPNNGYGGFGEA